MLTSVLPGLRELRTPLACGYMWLVAAWLAFSNHLPQTRPSAGLAASIWKLGAHVGRPATLAAVTFAAYLIGAILEFDPIALWRSRGIPSATSLLRTIRVPGATIEFGKTLEQAEADDGSDSEIVSGADLNPQDQERTAPDASPASSTDIESETQRVIRSLDSLRSTMSGRLGLETMQAFATALQASSAELFGRYDRLQAEASLRLNITAPLTALLELVIWQSSLLVWIKIPLSLVPVSLAAILLRQSLLRVRSANQVLIRAQLVGILDADVSGTVSLPEMSASIL